MDYSYNTPQRDNLEIQIQHLAWLSGVYFAERYLRLGSGESGTILNTTDGGFATWNTPNSYTNRHLAGVYFLDTRTGFAVATQEPLFALIEWGK